MIGGLDSRIARETVIIENELKLQAGAVNGKDHGGQTHSHD
jgi:hypothetical protein